ncbi:MAG TPA: ATP-binding cassette domain-containing protein [Candidatus Acidoferrum sp.]|nr:ATP-binding cassette domain-containing protein [Candidatus Acidoferrum sp.]
MTGPALSPPFLSLRNAAFRLGDRLVFEHTSWTWHRNEQWAIVGANGSGKSLLADGLRGRLPLVHGDLTYHFRPPSGLSAEEAIGHVAFEDRKADLRDTVVQSRWNSLEEEGALRVRDFLAYDRVVEVNPFEVSRPNPGLRAQFDRRRRRAVALLGVAPFFERRLISLSNGERQRVQLTQALSRPLRLLILDEPFTGLDTANRSHFHATLDSLMRGALRVLLLTTRPEDLPGRVTHVLRVEQCLVAAAGPRTRAPLPPMRTRPALAPHRPARLSPQPPPLKTENPGLKTPLIAMRHVTVRYGNSTILEDVTWSVRSGESWALLGPNGSGKTTLLSLILGDNPQCYANAITVFGHPHGDGASIWRLKRRIGWVSPELHLHFGDHATCFEVVASGFYDTVGLYQVPTRRQKAAAREWLRRFNLLEHAARPLFVLSMGLQRAVLLARALVKNPPLLMLDEPCQGLDAEHRRLFVRLVDELIRTRSTTVIYVTHRTDEIPPAIKRVLRLDRGQASVGARP